MRIRVLGGFSVWVGSRRVEEGAWRLRKAANLVKLLALSPGHHLHRERIVDLLWPDLAKKAASNNLRRTLHVVRGTLAPNGETAARYLALQGGQIALCPEGDIWVDAEAFEEAAFSAQRGREPSAYEAAIDLYPGELLPDDRYEEWAEERRRGLHETYTSLFIGLALAREGRADYGPAIEALRMALREEPANEEAHAGLMRLYALSGRKSEALAQYQRLGEALYRNLGTEPGAKTRALHVEIAAGVLAQTQPTAPPLEEQPAMMHNLPAPKTSFIGREREMVEVKRTLAMTKLLTLTGAGGCGKTRLALEVARDVAGTYPDGVWVVDLAPLSEGELVAHAVAEVLGVAEQPDRPLTATLAEALKGAEMLIVLDNCEHLVEACASVVDVLLGFCPEVRILATAREPLHVAGEVIWSVPPLSVPDVERPLSVEGLTVYDSARLFVERALRRPGAFVLTAGVVHAVAEICQELDGMPLAIELAAAKVGILAVGQISERLGDSLKLLSGGNLTAPLRQQTLRGTLDWSYDLLTEQEKSLFRRLSIFSGGWTLEAAERVGAGDGVEEGDVLNLLGRLVDKSLVGAEEGPQGSLRYRFLEPVRQYAREKLDASGEADAIRRRHAGFFLALAEEAEPELKGMEQEGWLERLETEHDNFRAALSWALELGEAEMGLRLSAALVEFWHLHVHHSEARRWLEGALAKAGGPLPARMKALARSCFLAWEQADYERAVAQGEEALVLARRLGDKVGAATVLVSLGSVAMSRVELERASALLEEAVALWRESGDGLGLAHGLYTLGMVAVVRRDHDRATAMHEESLTLARKSGDEVSIVRALGQGALTALVRDDHAQTYALSRATIEASRRLGIAHYATACLSILAASAASQHRPVRAIRLWSAETALREDMGIPRMPAEASFYEPYFVAVRTELDEPTWERAWSEGRAMSMEEAIEYALSEDKPAPPASPAEPRQRPTVTGRVALTRREQEVAVLVTRGLTNRQIATELVISEHTAATHVAKILRKLGLHSRSELATWITEQRLPPPD